MPIPPLIHQTWKNASAPLRWRHLVRSVKDNHPGWTYRLWTDAEMDSHVRAHHPALHPVYAAFEKNVMRADVFRYVLMYDLGGLYCDLDYEFLRSYPYGDARLVLSQERSPDDGDDHLQVANYVFASVPGHPFWRDVLDDLVHNPPVVRTVDDVIAATGPSFLTRIFVANGERYEGVVLTPRPVFSPRRARGRNEGAELMKSGAFGIHHAWGSWKERLSLHYLRNKTKRLLRR